jgi:hypothetical protein
MSNYEHICPSTDPIDIANSEFRVRWNRAVRLLEEANLPYTLEGILAIYDRTLHLEEKYNDPT